MHSTLTFTALALFVTNAASAQSPPSVSRSYVPEPSTPSIESPNVALPSAATIGRPRALFGASLISAGAGTAEMIVGMGGVQLMLGYAANHHASVHLQVDAGYLYSASIRTGAIATYYASDAFSIGGGLMADQFVFQPGYPYPSSTLIATALQIGFLFGHAYGPAGRIHQYRFGIDVDTGVSVPWEYPNRALFGTLVGLSFGYLTR